MFEVFPDGGAVPGHDRGCDPPTSSVGARSRPWLHYIATVIIRVLVNVTMYVASLVSSVSVIRTCSGSVHWIVDRSPTKLPSSAIPSNRETSICLLLSRLGTTRQAVRRLFPVHLVITDVSRKLDLVLPTRTRLLWIMEVFVCSIKRNLQYVKFNYRNIMQLRWWSFMYKDLDWNYNYCHHLSTGIGASRRTIPGRIRWYPGTHNVCMLLHWWSLVMSMFIWMRLTCH